MTHSLCISVSQRCFVLCEEFIQYRTDFTNHCGHQSAPCNVTLAVLLISETAGAFIWVCVPRLLSALARRPQRQSHCVCLSADAPYFAWQLASHTSQGLYNNTPRRGDSLIGFLKESLACICILIDKCVFLFFPVPPSCHPLSPPPPPQVPFCALMKLQNFIHPFQNA